MTEVCPRCGSANFRIAGDMYSSRHCKKCHNHWLDPEERIKKLERRILVLENDFRIAKRCVHYYYKFFWPFNSEAKRVLNILGEKK